MAGNGLSRLHPRLVFYEKILIPKNTNIYNVTFYPDVQELLVSSDIAISDYSSCMFDFLLTGNPGFIYAPDIEAYNNERGFYYPLEQTPFPIARNNAELKYNIQKFNLGDYKSKVENFLKDKGCIDDGQASVRVCDLIDQILNK